MKRILFFLFAVSMILSVSANFAPARSATVDSKVPFWMKRQCKTEDSINCYWDAQKQGNHIGNSFVVRKMPHSNRVCIFYVKTDAYDNCTMTDGNLHVASPVVPTANLPKWATTPCHEVGDVDCRYIPFVGYAFMVREIPRSQLICVFYVNQRYARAHDFCVSNQQ